MERAGTKTGGNCANERGGESKDSGAGDRVPGGGLAQRPPIGVGNASEIRQLMAVVKREIGRMTGNPRLDADDILQEVMIVILKVTGNEAKAKPRVLALPWVRAVVRSQIANYARRMARHGAYVDQFTIITGGGMMRSFRHVELDYLPDSEPASLHASCAEDKELFDYYVDKLPTVMASLTEPLRQVLLLKADGLSYEEIAEATGAKLGTVRSRLHYARQAAREILTAA